MQFSTVINAPKDRVWDTLWQDGTLREWAGLIDPGTYMVGDLKQGNEVQFISAENGYGVTSLVEKLTPGEYLLLAETYGITTLTVAFDVPSELEEYFGINYPKALERVKALAERKN